MLTPVKPCRLYRFILDPSGVPVDIAPDFRNLSANRAFWKDWHVPPVITREELGELVRVFNPALPDEIFEMLFSHLDLIRSTVPAQDAVPEQYPARRLDELLDKILKDLPAVIEDESNLLAAFYPGRSFQKNQELWLSLSEIKRFHRAALRFRERFRERIPPVRDKFQPWHDDAIYLAMLIDRWASAAGFRMRWASDAAPGNTFIANSLYRAGVRLGERGRPTGDTVKQALKRHPHSSILTFKGD